MSAKARSGGRAGRRPRISVTMYRLGIGDCFLLAFPRQGRRPFHVMIDCGTVIGTPDAAQTVERVVRDVASRTAGILDLLVVTHEHWDHVSGFVQARAAFEEGITVKATWLAWTENPSDRMAAALRREREEVRLALESAVTHLQAAGAVVAARETTGLLEFFGATGTASTSEALKVVKGLCADVRYCDPGDDPVTLPGTKVRAYVLGPPRDEKLLKRVNPSTRAPETYSMAAAARLLAAVPADSGTDAPMAPFDARFQLPADVARRIEFFARRYWSDEETRGPDGDQSWRRIDVAGLESSPELALQLDSATNNTSLVLAFELEGGEVLLFPGDAQVGSWLSWPEREWKVGGKPVKGADLLDRVVFYKVGHHGSHNATLKEQGLELMRDLRLAMLPVDHAVAVRKGWDEMPLPSLVKRLGSLTGGRVIRSDQPPPPSPGARDGEGDLFLEIEI